MTLNRLDVDPQPAPDLLIAQTRANQTNDFLLTRSDSGRVGQIVLAGKGLTASMLAPGN